MFFSCSLLSFLTNIIFLVYFTFIFDITLFRDPNIESQKIGVKQFDFSFRLLVFILIFYLFIYTLKSGDNAFVLHKIEIEDRNSITVS